MRHSDSSAERIAPLPSLSNYRTVEQAYTEHALIDSRTMSIVEGSLLHASVPDFASACKSSFSHSKIFQRALPRSILPSINTVNFSQEGVQFCFKLAINLKSRFTIPTVFDQISKTSSFPFSHSRRGWRVNRTNIWNSISKRKEKRVE